MSEQAPPLGHNKNHPLRDLRGTLPAHHPSNFCLSCRPPCVSWSLGVSVSSLCLYASVFLSDFSIHTPGYSISLCLYPSVSILASCPSSPVPPFGLSLFSLPRALTWYFPFLFPSCLLASVSPGLSCLPIFALSLESPLPLTLLLSV